MTEKCGNDGIHEFEVVGEELYHESEQMMKRVVRCKDCHRKAIELYALMRRTEID